MDQATPIVLLIEDDTADQEILRRAVKHGFMRAELRIVSNGTEALDYLHHRGRYAPPNESPQPDLILLDLNMPGLSGLNTLSKIRSGETTKSMPVVIFTTSDSMKDVARSYELGANTFITKPTSYEEITRKLQIIDKYWFDISILPYKQSA
jgi:CheY-like chemotaxis protein